jgi:hypothetical protein
LDSVAGFLAALVFLVVVYQLYIGIPVRMAQNRRRSALVWVLIGIVGSPLLGILLLYALGPAPEA